ncbi:M48 family metallopeptidase [Pyxidicoccus xibeiensis]|uniref:M48 family metallopeptidase n=1 Tax=Pyxidicoccus xibeiensis TaxID=2906759 RepID=UPI0020A70384|nr:M48 family metallopeptidase [Pyxidicoccus xibeiensis]MCP3137289.1 M48 family metallopeptidase [Pyxidicoccus xibeiensis]
MDSVNPSGVARRAVLTVVLWAGFWLLGLAVAAGLLWVPIAEERYTGSVGLSGLLSAAGALTVLWALRPRGWFSREKRDEVRPLTREDFPALFTLLDEVAVRAGASVPRKVYLSGEATAFIAMERRWLGLRREPVVGIGLPLFAFLDREELASVLAHEYGHHQGGDLALGPWVYRTRRSIALAVDSLEDSAFFLDVPFQLYGRFFLSASSAVSRQQELAADALAASACGTRATASALRKVHALGPVWGAYFEHELLPLFGQRVRVPLLEGFRRFVAEEHRRADVEQGLQEALARPPSQWDSHPPLQERLRGVGYPGEGASTPASWLPLAGCLELLGGERAAEDTWVERSITEGLVSLAWEEIAGKVHLPELQKQWVGTAIDPGRTPLGALPGFLKEGEALWNRIRPQGLDLLSAEGKRQRVRRILVEWLGAALVHRGFLPQLRPGANLRFVCGDISVEPAVIVRRLAEGALSEAQYLEACELLEAASSQLATA